MNWLHMLFNGPPGTDPSVVWGYWVAAILTISIYSFLYKDNPLYKFAEALFVGIGAAYWMCLLYHETLDAEAPPAALLRDRGAALHVDPHIPGDPGHLHAAQVLSRSCRGCRRWALGFIVGMYSAVNITGFGQGDFVAQIYATMSTPLRGTPPSEIVLNLIAIIGVFAVLIYFFFSKEHKGALGGVAKLGIWFLMVAFGASFGYTVMGRVSLLIGRMTVPAEGLAPPDRLTSKLR